MADLAVSYELVVDKKIEAGINTLEVDVDLLAAEIFLCELEIADVERGRIDVGNVGRINGVGVVYVGVVGGIVSLAENGLPGARNGHLIETAGAEALSREIIDHRGSGIELEIPIAAEREKSCTRSAIVAQSGSFAVIRNEVRAWRLATVMQNFLGFVEFVFKAHIVISLNVYFLFI
jgi:hypothetical protein